MNDVCDTRRGSDDGICLLSAITVVAVFLWFAGHPVWHSDVWGHLAWGRHIVRAGALPDTEPMMPLARGVSVVDSAWLSQVLGYAAVQYFGTAILQPAHAGLVAIASGMLLLRFAVYSGRVITPLTGLLVFLAVNWQQLHVVRPQMVGQICFCLVLIALTTPKHTRWQKVLVPCLFAIWANAHGSFAVGLMLIGCFVGGRMLDLRIRAGSESVFRDALLRRQVVLLLLSSLASLANPYGLRLYMHVLTFAAHPQLRDIVEWQPLSLSMKQGLAALAAAVLAAVMGIRNRRPATPEIVAVIVFGAAGIWRSRMIHWWAPLIAWFLMIQMNDRSDKRLQCRPATVVACLAIMTGTIVFHWTRQPSNLAQLTSHATPVDAVAFLNNSPYEGLIFNSYEFGDYLLWAARSELQVFACSHVHLIPPRAWNEYRQILRLQTDWQAKLRAYHVSLVMLRRAAALTDELRRTTGWRMVYEDERTVIFVPHANAR